MERWYYYMLKQGGLNGKIRRVQKRKKEKRDSPA